MIMLKKFYISMVVLLFCTIGWAQTPIITVEAAKLYEQKELQRAKEKIDAAILTPQGKSDSYTWHVRGHIYKEIYKIIDKLFARKNTIHARRNLPVIWDPFI